jgi:hypothetical protein
MRIEEFAEVIAELSEAYDKIVPVSRSDQYFRAFETFPIHVFRAAAERAKRECEFFPTIAKLHGYLKDYMELSGALLSAEMGWVRACAVIDAHFRPGMDPAQLPYPNDACRIAVRTVGGEQRIADASIKSREFIRNEFVRAYEMVSMSAEVIGKIVNQSNAKRRYILINRFKLAEDQINPATGENIGPGVCWDTVELRPARMELYELQQRMLGDGDATAEPHTIGRRDVRAIAGSYQPES